jgi:hypothetical protein
MGPQPRQRLPGDAGDHPPVLGPGRVLDQSAERQRAGGRDRPGLLVRQVENRGAQRVALLRQEGEQAVTLIRDRPGEQGHITTLAQPPAHRRIQ